MDPVLTRLKSHKDAVAASITSWQSQGLTWADLVGLLALVARDQGEGKIATALGAAARRCVEVEESRDSPN